MIEDDWTYCEVCDKKVFYMQEKHAELHVDHLHRKSWKEYLYHYDCWVNAGGSAVEKELADYKIVTHDDNCVFFATHISKSLFNRCIGKDKEK